ncbi:hypothetical protein C8039_02640 [Halogeometricum sp. wsp3]|nr:hypothetical protein C8039_02640 [Halogeometricum sp. wsp3]
MASGDESSTPTRWNPPALRADESRLYRAQLRRPRRGDGLGASGPADAVSQSPERRRVPRRAPLETCGRNDRYELLGVVIGEQCRTSAIAGDGRRRGLHRVNDISNRDDQRREQNWVRGKAFDNSARLDPFLPPPTKCPTMRASNSGSTARRSSRPRVTI